MSRLRTDGRWFQALDRARAEEQAMMTREEARKKLEGMRTELSLMIDDDVLPHSKADVHAHRAHLEITNVLSFFRNEPEPAETHVGLRGER